MGKSTISMGHFPVRYVSHNQRVWIWSRDLQWSDESCAKLWSAMIFFAKLRLQVELLEATALTDGARTEKSTKGAGQQVASIGSVSKPMESPF